MDTLLWVLLPGFAAVATGVLAWFVMQARMDVALANQRVALAEAKGGMEAEKSAVKAAFQSAVRAAEETARRQAFDSFLGEIVVEQRHYTRETQTRKSMVLQERMFFRNIPLTDWIEHEAVLQDNVDVPRLMESMTIFDKSVVNIADVRPAKKALA